MDQNLVGLIPAAGKGERLGLPYPKELYPIIRNNRYKPVAQFVLETLVGAGAKHVIFVINETKHQLIGYFGDGHRFGCDISYVVQEPLEGQGPSTSPGLAHALDSAHHLTKGKSVLFGMADTIIQPRDALTRAYGLARSDDDLVLMLFATEHPERFGMVRCGDDGQVIRVEDKPRVSDLKEMWGSILWRPSFTEFLHDCVARHGASDFARIMNDAIAAGFRSRGIKVADGIYMDLGSYDEILEMDHRFRDE